MSEWTRVKLTIPVEYSEAANRLASIFDPDSGGANTFGVCQLSPTGEEPATHYMASTLVRPGYTAALTDPELAMQTLTVLAEEYDREPPVQQDVDDWCENVLVGDPEGPQRIVVEEEI